MGLMPYMFVFAYLDIVVGWQVRSVVRNIISVFCFFQALGLLCLNIYWYTLILKGVRAMLREVGVLAKPKNKEKDAFAGYDYTQSDAQNDRDNKKLA